MSSLNALSLTNAPEACFYDEQLDQIVLVSRNTQLQRVMSTMRLTDENASKMYYMLGAALSDMGVIRRIKVQVQ